MVKYRETYGNKSWNKCGERTTLSRCYLGCTSLLTPMEISVHEDLQRSIPILGYAQGLYPATEKFAHPILLLLVSPQPVNENSLDVH